MKKFEIWGAIVGPTIDGQKVASRDTLEEATTVCDSFQDRPNNHPDLHFWVCESHSIEVLYPS